MNGIWSGFPICCVVMYSLHHFRDLPISMYPVDFENYGYVRCAKCVSEGKYVKHIRRGYILTFHYIGSKNDKAPFRI